MIRQLYLVPLVVPRRPVGDASGAGLPGAEPLAERTPLGVAVPAAMRVVETHVQKEWPTKKTDLKRHFVEIKNQLT